MSDSFKIGDEVVLDSDSQWDVGYPSNPSNTKGTISGIEDGWYNVIWDNGYENNYEVEDLEHYQPKEKVLTVKVGAPIMESSLRKAKPKILVLGQARHGKDTFCEILRDLYGYKFESSSARIIKEFLPFLQEIYGFESFEEAYEGRYEIRDFLYQLVSGYNSKDLTRMAKLILQDNDIYCGMRKMEEVEACYETDMFDIVVWIDASERLGDTEPRSSCTVMKCQADVIIENNGNKEEFEKKVMKFAGLMGGGYEIN